MKLKSLILHGFKSFPDRTTLDFREGVTAIVGSNGCGKSNLADAVRWVLGEQRASAVRGSKMDEVIFQGTAKRRPLNFAEVSLIFDNESGRVPVPQSEIVVNRKAFREGGSEYSLNRESCRLRDVQSLLRDTGLGSNAYAIIEAGMIETLLSDRAEERRALFEEAAGIGKYKDSRLNASRRLQAAEGDLARLDDLINEVQSKVRSLARQRGKAQRHQDLQKRRLDLEVAIAKQELSGIVEALAESEKRHHELGQEALKASAELSTAEAVEQKQRLAGTEMGGARAAGAPRLDDVRRRLDAHEREVLLTDERQAHANMRLDVLERERKELEQRRTALISDADRDAAEHLKAQEELETVRTKWEAVKRESEATRLRVMTQRSASEKLAAESRELARQIATAEAERAAVERRNRDAADRLTRLQPQQAALETELARVGEQTELWTAQADELRSRAEDARKDAEKVREDLRALRSQEAEARNRVQEAEDVVSKLRARVDAREAVEKGYEGFAPVVAAVMANRERFPGVHGPLADFVDADAEAAVDSTATEGYLGPLLQALVIDDLGTARELRAWLHDEWEGEGSLLLLPLDAPGSRPAGSAGDRTNPFSGKGSGAAWVNSLLSNVTVLTHGDALESYTDRVVIDRNGDVVDERGSIRVSTPGEARGILSRRREVARLKADLVSAVDERGQLRGERARIREAVDAAEAGVIQADENRRLAEEDVRRLEADTAAQIDRRSRLDRERDELVRSVATLHAGMSESAAQLEALEAKLSELASIVETSGAGAEAARDHLKELESAWEVAREQEAELRVTVARAEGEVRDLERRVREARSGAEASAERLIAIDTEEVELRGALDEFSKVREHGAREIENLFGARDREAAELAALDGKIAALETEISSAAERATAARRRESDSSEERHRLELEHADLRSRLERIRERLEVEWGRPWQALVESAEEVVEGELENWRAELARSASQIDALGPVNMLAVEEHAEEERRLNFLLEQRTDLVKARDDLSAAIRQINETARDIFQETFDAVRDNFGRTFQSLFAGGDCDIRLEDPDDPLESPVEIQASPKGKKTQRIHLLSGGERTLTALALLFALYLVKPSPFCVLDEVDAPLDDSNVGRFLKLLEDFKSETQFVVITHNPRTMESADWIYGVTMEEAGVSTIVGVELLGAWQSEDQVA